MGKRYGRNQKRAHRARIAELETAYNRELELITLQGRKNRELQEIIDEMCCIIRNTCRYSSALKPKEVFSKEQRERLDIEVLEHAFDFESTGPEDVPSPMEFKLFPMYILEDLVKEYADTFSKSVHLKYGPEGETKYMISEVAFRTMPWTRIRDVVLPEVVKKLILMLRKQQL